MTIRAFLLVLLSLTLSQLLLGCTQETPENLIQQAKQAQQKASSVQGEWRDVGRFIQQAEKALVNGEKEKAIQLALKAHEQADLGYEQAQMPVQVNPKFLH